MAKKSKNKQAPGTIALNRKARHEYTIETKFEAGIQLQGWEVKSIRAGKVNLSDSYVIIKKEEAYLLGAQITPLISASTHVIAEGSRTRKLLLHRKEIKSLIGSSERDGYTIVSLSMYWKKNHVKVEIALAKGKKTHDKRASSKEKDWQRQKQRIFQKNIKQN